jgi:ubiquinone/menaquinone biosynthesis C-methylase UbiE
MSESLIHSLFSQSAQRLLLLEWLAERSRFDNDIEEANLFVQLQELEKIQAFGHLDFLLDNVPLLSTAFSDTKSNLTALQKHLANDFAIELSEIKSKLQQNSKFDMADWINTVTRQNQEMLRILQEFQVPKHHSQLVRMPPTKDEVVSHFSDRAERYDRSSNWCTDQKLRDQVLAVLPSNKSAKILDIACGTGLVSQWFHDRGNHVTGVDITPAMFEQARERLDEFRVGPGEDLPVESNEYDIVICRQGTQFMDDVQALSEMKRAVRPGGVICVINLCAYGEEDKEEYFEILRLRNPVRRNFYLCSDLKSLFEKVGLQEVVIHEHISHENVDVWSDNGAISESRREAIREMYRRASDKFSDLHRVELDETGEIIDKMLFAIAIGTKPFSS